MLIPCIYSSPHETCRAVLELRKSAKEKKRLFAIQYNRFLSESTTWWLSPVGVNPAYKYPKFGFVPSGDAEIIIGLYVEKGLGRDSQCPSTQVMDSTWFWHTFLKEIETDEFCSALNATQTQSRTPPEIYIESFVGPEKESVSFLWKSTDGKLSAAKGFQGSVLEPMVEVADFHSLGACLCELTYRHQSRAFVWIDFIVGVRFELNNDTHDSWDAWVIEKNLLRHLEHWVR
ncbi:MAG TPA: hypothetical protein VEF34_10510 [Syntrophobacteraceae bacterium]|nr:hypothetical protein [Syntrophobacteraceae bacterium]